MKILPILIIIVLVFILHEGTTYGQTVLKEGFIITQLNDTIWGEIGFISNLKSYKSCHFKQNNETTIYLPSQILGYGFINGKMFSSQIQEDTFVEILVSGELSLFKDNSIFYIQKKGEDISKLELDIVTVGPEGEKTLISSDKWKGIVYFLISDCYQDAGAMQDMKLNFNEKTLTNLVSDYNKCRGSEFSIYNEDKVRTKLNFGVASGFTQSAITIIGLSMDPVFLDSKYESMDPSYGILVSLTLPEIIENMALQAEAHYIKSSFGSSFLKTAEYNFIKAYYDSYIKLTTLVIPVSLKYYLPEKKCPLYLQAGYSFFYNFHSESKIISEFERRQIITTYEYPAIDIVKSHSDFWGRIGVFKRFDRFEGSIALSYYRLTNPLIGGSFGYTGYIDRLMFSIILFSK